MKIKYTNYFLGDRESTKYTLKFARKNLVVKYNTFDAIDGSRLYVFEFDYSKGVYNKYNYENMEFLSSGQIRNGWWASNIEKESNFVKFDTYLGYDCILIKQESSSLKQYVRVLNSEILRNVIDRNLIDNLSISSTKMLGFKYEGFNLVCEKIADLGQSGHHCTFRINSINP